MNMFTAKTRNSQRETCLTATCCALLALAILLLGMTTASAESPIPQGEVAAAPPTYLVDLSSATTGDKLLVISLQGLANRDPAGPSIYTLSGPNDEGWLFWATHIKSRPVEKIAPGQLLEKFRHLVKGQILCDAGDPLSLNIATSLAGIHSGVLTESDLGLLTLFDMRGKFKTPAEAYKWAEKEILPKCSKSAAALLGISLPFRDYIIKEKLLALPFPSDKAEWTSLGKLLSAFPSGVIFGPAREAALPAMAGWTWQTGHTLVAAGEAANLSFHSQFYSPGRVEPPPLRQWRKFTPLEGKIYVSFLFSGGDDLAYAANRMSSLWQQSERGRLPLGWILPSALAETAPDILQAYYAKAYRGGNDTFALFASANLPSARQVNRPTQARPGAFHGEPAESIAYLKKAQAKTDTRALIVLDDSPQQALLPALGRLIAETQPTGIFLPDRKALPSRMMGNIPLITKGFSSSSPQEILQRLSALSSPQGGLIFVRVEANAITPADIISIVSQLPPYFEVVGPEEFIFLAKQALTGQQQEIPSQTKIALSLPEFAKAGESVLVRATTEGSGDALLVYQQEGGPRFMEPMEKQQDGSYAVNLKPLLHGGEWLLQARLSEGQGKTAWSETARLRVPHEDADDDGLDAPEERLFATDPQNPDTDGDGLLDGTDPYPLTPDTNQTLYFGPLRPSEDSPFLVEEQGATLTEGAKKVSAGGHVVYRLSAEAIPPDADAVIALRLDGEAQVSFSDKNADFGPPIDMKLQGEWRLASMPRELAQKKSLFVRISPGGAVPADITLHEIAIFSNMEAPSIDLPALTPPHPGPGMPVGVSAAIWATKGLRSAWCAYRSGRGYISLPLERDGRGPVWLGELGRFDNSTRLDWWIIAEDTQGRRSTSRVMHTWVGAFPGETISLTAGRELKGAWRSALAEWDPARASDRPGEKDSALVQVSGGAYEVWALVGGRGRGMEILMDDNFLARIDPSLPNGWQHLGRIRLAAGSHRLDLVCGTGPQGTTARYSQLLLTTISSLRPPAGGPLELADSLSLFAPLQGEKIGPRTEVAGSAAGNIARVDFYVDSVLLRRFTSPPFSFFWDSGRLPAGKHLLRMVGLSRAGQPLVTLQVEVIKE